MSAPTADAAPVTADPVVTRSYFRTVYGTADAGFLAIFTGQNRQTRWFPVSGLEAAAAAACDAADRGFDVYHGMGLHPKPLGPAKRGTADGICAIPGAYMDLDLRGPGHTQTALPESIEDVLALLREFALFPNLIIFSGGGLYADWLFREVLTLETPQERARAGGALKRLQAEIRRLGREHGWRFDSTADFARVLRPPGTINYKGEPVAVRILHQGGVRYTLEAIEDALPADDTEPRLYGGPTEGRPRPAVAPILRECAFLGHCRDDAEILPEPEWHAMLSIVSLCQDGEQHAHELSKAYPRYTEGETKEKYKRARAADKPIKCETIESLFGDEWCAACKHRGTITSPIQLGYARIDRPGRNGATAAGDAGERDETSERRFIWTAHELLQEPFPADEPLVTGIVDRGGALSVFGPGGTGKTWIGLSLALSLAVPRPWLDHFVTEPGRVLIVDQEGRPDRLQHRLRRLCAGGEITPETPLIYARPSGWRIDTDRGRNHLRGLVDEHGPDVLLLDSLTRFHSADENKSQEMAGVAQCLAELTTDRGIALILIDHASKFSASDDPRARLRGSTDKLNALDAAFYVERSLGSAMLNVTPVKSRYDVELPPFGIAFEHSDGGTRMTYVDGAATTATPDDACAAVVRLSADDPYGATVDNIGLALFPTPLMTIAQRSHRTRQLLLILEKQGRVIRVDVPRNGSRGGRKIAYQARDER